MDASNTRRIVLLGKTGVGKSSLANTIFGQAKFQINYFNDFNMHWSQAETQSVNGRSITLIDTPGFFDKSEADTKPEIVRCITECAPGPHAFLIVLKVEKFTEQEQDVIAQICEIFSEDALKYAAVVFTHGDQLPEETKIEEFVGQSEGLSDLVEKCGGRCYVVDNKYWKNSQQDEYRSNQLQVTKLLNTIELVIENNVRYYTNDILREVEEAIQKEEERIRQSPGNMSQGEIRKQAKNNVFKKKANSASPTRIRAVLGFAVIAGLLATVSALLINSKSVKVLKEAQNNKDSVVISMAAGVEKPVSEQASITGAIVEVLITPVKIIQKTFEAVMNKLYALYERTYNPWNPFE